MKTKFLILTLSILEIMCSCNKNNVPEKSQLPNGALSGKFTVNSAGKQVHFSKGNLIATIKADGSPKAWKFATNQYDRIGKGGANCTIGTDAGDIDLFGWSTASTTYGISTSIKAKDYSGDFVDWGNAYCKANNIDAGTWRTLSGGEEGEWNYIICKRNNASKLCGYGVTVCGNPNCLILAPDDFTGEIKSAYNAAEWTVAESAGIVCFPAAGGRYDTDASNTDRWGTYWSSTASNNDHAYRISFDGSIILPAYTDSRCLGCSVRLITEAK